jgi:hypothetical protein
MGLIVLPQLRFIRSLPVPTRFESGVKPPHSKTFAMTDHKQQN